MEKIRNKRILLNRTMPEPEPDMLEEDEDDINNGLNVGFCILMCGIILIGGCLLARPGHANSVPITPQTAVKACLGEAEGEPYLGKVAMLEVARNRGFMQGIYGYKAIKQRQDGSYWRGKRKIGEKAVNECRQAYKASLTSNITKNSTHFENTSDFGVPYWAHKMIKTVKIGSHQFYRER